MKLKLITYEKDEKNIEKGKTLCTILINHWHKSKCFKFKITKHLSNILYLLIMIEVSQN